MPELNETRFAGHFTQLIWNSTEYVGFGVAADGQGKVTVVAQYSPKGNIKFQYDANVPPRMDGILHNFPEEGAAFTIPKGERKTLEDIKKEGGTSSLFVEKSDSGNEENTTQTENTLDDNFSELNSTQGNASQNNNHNNFSRNNSQYKSKNSNIQNPHNRIQEEYSNEDEGRASSITEDKSNSSLSVEDIKIEDNDGLGELVTDFSQQTTLRASHRITTSLKRHQCTLDNLNMYSIKSNAARKEEISDFFQYEMIYFSGGVKI